MRSPARGRSLQALLGNPLADPHLLGVSAGAAVAGAIALMAGADPVSPIVPLAAFVGALATVAAVFVVARSAGRTSPYAILLVGVVCNALGAAAIMLVNAIASYTQAQGVLFWIMGSLSAQSYGLVAVAGLYALAGAAVLLRHAHHLNLLAAGEEGALTLGVEVEAVRRAVFLASSLLVGAAVAVSGMISFVGLIVPHVLRLAPRSRSAPLAAGVVPRRRGLARVGGHAGPHRVRAERAAGRRRDGAARRPVLPVAVAAQPATGRIVSILVGRGGELRLRRPLRAGCGRRGGRSRRDRRADRPERRRQVDAGALAGRRRAPGAGVVRLDGRPLADWSRRERARRIALVPQDPRVEFPYTVLEVVLMGRAPHLPALALPRGRATSRSSRERARSARGRRTSRRAASTRCRAASASACSWRARWRRSRRVLLLDEPTTHLDLRHQTGLHDIARQRCRQDGLGVLSVLHDLNLAAAYCDRLVLLAAGRVVCAGPPADVLEAGTLEAVFGTRVWVGRHGVTAAPVVLPLPRRRVTTGRPRLLVHAHPC